MSLAGLTAALLIGVTVHPFLSRTERASAEYLVVEGWISDYALEEAAKEFEARGYKLLIVTGAPLTKGSFLTEYRTHAEVAAATLRRLGLSTNSVAVVASEYTRRGRTHQSAEAVRKWFEQQNLTPRYVNIFTMGAHARRSWLMYRNVLPRETEVGVIAVENREYDPNRWWAYSAGLRTVIGESAGYIHARVFGN